MPKTKTYKVIIEISVKFTENPDDYRDGQTIARFAVRHEAITSALEVGETIVDNLNEIVVRQVKKEIEVKLGEVGPQKPEVAQDKDL